MRVVFEGVKKNELTLTIGLNPVEFGDILKGGQTLSKLSDCGNCGNCGKCGDCGCVAAGDVQGRPPELPGTTGRG